MDKSNKVNMDILSLILKDVSISNVKHVSQALCPKLDNDSIARCVESRLNPLIYLRQLTMKPDELLATMLTYKVVLSGSRAANYFYPGLSSADSDWDFFCDGNSIDCVNFVKHMHKIGVVWQYDPTTEEDNPQYSVATGIIEIDKKLQKIQLIWLDNPTSTLFERILAFHSSIVQCFISGFGAFCMYDKLTCMCLSLPWVSDPESSNQTIINHREARDKYVDRGVRYVSYDWYTGIQSLDGRYMDHSIVEPRNRHILDSGCRTVNFTQYYSSHIMQEKVINCFDQLEDKFKWLETPYHCVKVGLSSIPDSPMYHYHNDEIPHILKSVIFDWTEFLRKREYFITEDRELPSMNLALDFITEHTPWLPEPLLTSFKYKLTSNHLPYIAI